VILAAGRGTRMQSMTAGRPKPLIEVGGKALVEHILDRLCQAGARSFLVVTGYRATMIEDRLAKYPAEIAFRRQAMPDGTARAARLAREFAGNDPFLLTFGDILADPDDYRAMAAVLESDPTAAAVLAVQYAADPWRGAAVYENGGRVTAIVEKPPPGSSTTNWNSAGIYVFRPEVFDELERVPRSPRGEYELTSAIAQLIAGVARVLMHPVRGPWLDVGRPEDVAAAERMVRGQGETEAG